MGQQQLLLLVLGIVIVGLAVVVGVEAFSENQKKANLDALVNGGVRIASDVQIWSLKPSVFGGPGEGEDWTDATFTRIGYTVQDDGTYATSSGTFTLAGGVLTAEGTYPGNAVTVEITGTEPGHVATTANSAGALGN
ncbi:hypothetical protein RQM47_14065 [Rubrivirga sp. S365]|uniref:Uncharacterized protein n=1 Tax=Rubrivirga litoralis TaxID=3075598 RepID=A0ABU3BV49_9BACT|nr:MULTISPECIES: hypothetical protein [unclassified Rubrivirga]MDT0633165.1 hypothetical protein [Rubrivirga sp. F394]MDT7857772.1 hypothetical protein [Rubrivirga sp. S365]